MKRFLSVHRRWSALTGNPLKWDLWELWSCSGRVSTKALGKQLAVGFPVDLRYGWDFRRKDHRDLLDQVFQMFRPEIVIAAPECRLWSAANRTPNMFVLEASRQAERPALA